MDCCNSQSNEFYQVPTQQESQLVTDGTMYAGEGYCPEGQQSASTWPTLLGVLGGAGVGAALMYLLDSEHGHERRQYLAEKAGGTWETVRDKAGEYGHRTSNAASRLGRRISESGYYDAARDRARYLVHGRESHGIESGTGQLFAGLGLLAAGVGAMYLMDSRCGASRRAVLRDRFLSGFGRMATYIERTGQDLWNRASGTIHEARGMTSRQQVDDRVLVERVRSEIGRCVSNTGALEVSARNGAVVVSGHVLNSEVDDLLRCVWRTRGVTELVNRLEVHPDAVALQRAQNLASTRQSMAGGTGFACATGTTARAEANPT